MPPPHINNLIEVLEQVADTFDDSIDPNILFEWVGPCQIVVPVISRPPNEAASHISFSLDGQECNLKLDIGFTDHIHQHDLIGMFRTLSHQLAEHLRWTLGPISLKNLPVPREPTIQQGANRKIFGESSGDVSIKGPC